MTQKIKSLLSDIIGGLFIILFIYAAVSKLSDLQKFRVEMGKSPMLYPFAAWMIYAVPILELLIAALIMYKRSQFIGLCAGYCLMVMFTAYIVAILNFSSYIPCSCGGILQNMTWTQHLWFNGLFVLLGICAIWIYPKLQATVA